MGYNRARENKKKVKKEEKKMVTWKILNWKKYMTVSPIILIYLLGIPLLAHHRKKQYLWSFDKILTLISHILDMCNKRGVLRRVFLSSLQLKSKSFD